MFVAAPVVLDGEIAGAVRLAASTRSSRRRLRRRNHLLAICAAASLLILLILAVTAGGTSRSLRKLAEMIERITGRRFGRTRSGVAPR